MAELQQGFAPRGLVHFSPSREIEPIPNGYLEPRRARPHILRIGAPRELTDVFPHVSKRKQFFKRSLYGSVKLASSRENVRRVLRLSKYGPSLLDWDRATAQSPAESTASLDATPAQNSVPTSNSTELASASSASAPAAMSSRDSIVEVPSPQHSNSQSMISMVDTERPVASGNGVSVSIVLAEPVLFLQGFDSTDFEERNTTMLRGHMKLRVTKSAKIKAVTLKFRGKAETEWPEGIPPKKIEYKSTESLMNHTWTLFNATFPNPEANHGADTVLPLKVPTTTTREIGFGESSFDSPISSPRHRESFTPREMKRLSLQEAQTRSFTKSEINSPQKGYRTFTPGDYIYNFELPIDSRLPETIDVELGTVKYELEAIVERSGAFRANLVGSKEVRLIRAPREGSLETIEPIAISRDWEDQLHYDIVISGKSFPLGSQIPIAFKLTPLAKVRCHRIKVYVTENIQYFTSNKRVHRLEPTRRIQLFEKRADGPSTSTFPGSSFHVLAGGGVEYDSRAAAASGDESVLHEPTNLLGRLEGDFNNVGPTELEINVQLPSCHQAFDKDKNAKIHFDTTYSNIQVHHWIKIVMRLSRPDTVDPAKQRHFEISIDSPLHILSCRATYANMCLPAYSSPEPGSRNDTYAECGCPDAVRRRGTITSIPSIPSRHNSDETVSSESSSNIISPPPAAHVHQQRHGVSRPMHLLRAPSYNPPAFSDDDPPPLVTPPPQYESAIDGDPRDALADYFSRLADEMGSDDDETNAARRVDVPLTPGGRVNRSMDARRTWLPVGGNIPAV